MMKKILFLISAVVITISFALISCDRNSRKTDETVTVSGIVADYNGNPIPNATVRLQNNAFESVAETITDNNGHYTLHVKKGRYYAMFALDTDTYPHTAAEDFPEEDMRLEFWAWNFIADRDMDFDIQYHRIEVYGINIFRIQGATPGYTIYCRPMSLTRTIEWITAPSPSPYARMSPAPGNAEVKVTINGEEVQVRLVQEVEEYFGEGQKGNAFLISVGLPSAPSPAPYDIFRITISDLENGDKGEGVFFLEKKEYVKEQ